MEKILEMRHVTKRFPGVIALDDISIEVHRGEVLAICGENGAGKSTLMNILSGKYNCSQYEGEIYIEGKKQNFTCVAASKAAGIEMVYQELNVLYDSSVAENIFVGSLPTNHGILDYKMLFQQTQEALAYIGLDIPPQTIASKLNSGQLQMVSIVRALVNSPKILVFDEPTSALSDQETDKLMNVIGKLREQGVTCLFISHKLDEVFRIADRVVVMRDGKFVSCRGISEVTEDSLIADMVGRQLAQMYPTRNYVSCDEVMRVEHLTVPHPTIQGRNIVDDIAFSLHKGEILGIGGLVGAGRSEAMMAVFGADHRPGVHRKIFLDGKETRISSPSDAVAAGIGFVTEERKLTGFIPNFSICWNLTLAKIRNLPLRFGMCIDHSAERKQAEGMFQRMNVKAPSIDAMIVTLSGGNQQKVILGKWLLKEPRILIVDEPTKGIDVGAKAEFYKIMDQLTQEGVSIIMISSDMAELISMSDRCLVLGEGKIRAELTGKELTQDNVLRHAI